MLIEFRRKMKKNSGNFNNKKRFIKYKTEPIRVEEYNK